MEVDKEIDTIVKDSGGISQKNGSSIASKLREFAVRGLERMYLPEKGVFVFRVRKSGDGIVHEGVSHRYTAIVLIGLAGEKREIVEKILKGDDLTKVCSQLKRSVPDMNNLGDIALALWAASVCGYKDTAAIKERLLEMKPVENRHPVVEISWALDALCADNFDKNERVCRELASRLISLQNEDSSIFSHVPEDGSKNLRSHVSCFADMVYPIHALSRYYKLSQDQKSIEAASRGAKKICELSGPAGQWWWHYDNRVGEVVEGYPVYSVHQDSMAPLALFAVQDVGGGDFTKEIKKGLDWLTFSPEIQGSLIDENMDFIWRKVARREPGKFTRYASAITSGVHPSFRIPGLDMAFPPCSVDYENRPYHLGWILYAWPEERATHWDSL